MTASAASLSESLGRGLLAAVDELGRFLATQRRVFGWAIVTLGQWRRGAVRWGLRRPGPRVLEWRETLEQVVAIGVESVPVATVTALFTGMVVALEVGYTLEHKLQGISQLLGGLVTLSMLRELAPVLTSLIVAGRAGSAMAAEIGSMRVTEQVDALATLSADPLKYLFVPRLFACLVTLPMLVVFSDAIGVAGGYLVAHFRYGQSGTMYLENLRAMVELQDLLCGLLKSLFFGMLIAAVSCFKGYETTGGAEGVGRAATRAVVVSSMGILVTDYVLTALMSAMS